MREKIKRFDDYFIDLINKRWKTDFLDKFLYFITDKGGAKGSTIISIIILSIGLIFNNKILKILALDSLLAHGIGQILVQIIKITVKRIRPYDALEGVYTFGIDMPDYSFPSGHTTASFTMGTIIILNIPQLWLLGVLYAVIIGYSRIYLAVHYPTDVIFGVFLGIITALISHYYIFPYLIKYINQFII